MRLRFHKNYFIKSEQFVDQFISKASEHIIIYFIYIGLAEISLPTHGFWLHELSQIMPNGLRMLTTPTTYLTNLTSDASY